MIYSFFEFSPNILTGCGNIPLPVMYASDIAFYHSGAISSVDICSSTGSLIKSSVAGIYSTSRCHFKLSEEISSLMLLGTCFRLRINGSLYSNLLQYVQCANEDCSSTISYSCHDSQFGFDYEGNENKYNSVRLPMRMINKQYPKTSNVYVKSTGEQVVLTSTIGFEWDLDTDYIPEPWHEKLVVALAHDDVLVNGIRVTQEGDYTVLWQDSIDDGCSVKLVKGSTKLRGDSVMRNSNC